MSASDSDIRAHRLRNQHLWRARTTGPAGMVAWFGAMQAQDYPGARWAIGLRTRRLTDVDVRRAFDRGEIVRTHMMRPTWHFVAPADLRWMQTLTASRVHAVSASVYRRIEITPAVVALSQRVIARALEGGKTLTRTELGVILARKGVKAAGLRLAYIIMHAELDLLVCSGPLRGAQFTYALVDERVARTAARDRDESLRDLAVRYFTSHGPATVRDLSWWSGLTMREATRAVELAGRQLERVSTKTRTYWQGPPVKGAAPTGPVVKLLPNYDEFFIALKDRGLHDGGAATRAWFARHGGQFDAFGCFLFIDGRLAGTWRRRITDTHVTVDVTAHRRFTPAERAGLELEKARYAAFVGFRRPDGGPGSL